MKGQTSDTVFVLGLMFFIAFLSWLTLQIQGTYPEFTTIKSFDMLFFAGEIITIAGACVISTGLACAGSLAFFSATSFFIVENLILNILIFMPISVAVAFTLARLARGS